MYSDLAAYYHRWYHDRPVALRSPRREELHRLHRILMQCIGHLVRDYRSIVPGKMPLGEREMELLELQEAYPFHAGTFRPDYILSEKGDLLLCEITSRFFAHGMFMSWFSARWAGDFLSRHPGACLDPADPFREMMDHMRRMAGESRRMFVLKSADKSGEIRLYRRFYEAAGLEVNVLETAEIEPERARWDRPGTFLVSALNQRDLLGLETDTVRALLDRGTVSDLRNIFLIHDKRFMNLWFDDGFTGACLTPEDTAFLRAHAIPTFLAPPPDARENKDVYILKPSRLGKSEGVLAGPFCSREQWEAAFDSGAVGGMVIQPFIPQKTFPVRWEGTYFRDYLCGMMLCADDRLFDTGYFRCSSLPVTNLGDDRKAAVLYTDDPALLEKCDIL